MILEFTKVITEINHYVGMFSFHTGEIYMLYNNKYAISIHIPHPNINIINPNI